MSEDRTLPMGQAPFAFHKMTTGSLMWGTAAALMPALAWGILRFGPHAAVVAAAAIAGALAGEAVVSALRRRFSLLDGSAFLTGLLVAMAMPPGIRPFIPAAASLFAICVVKGAFGGLGSNWMNPALAGIAFSFINWPAEMRAFAAPADQVGVAALSGATPLAAARLAAPGSGALEAVANAGARFSGTDGAVTDGLNRGIFSFLGADLPRGYIDLFLGNKLGTIGEISAALLLAASILLVSRRMIRWEIPAAISATFIVFTWAFGGLHIGSGLFAGDALFSVLTGSFLLVAFFMATDPVTSPSSRGGMLIYGCGVGTLSFLFRTFGGAPEGTAYAVLVMNCAVPALIGIEESASRKRAARSANAMETAGAELNGGGREHR
jgi:Na+-translocating ferredoxin:NAD+ oxidoreductase subunit D